MTSRNLWSDCDRHLVGITWLNVWCEDLSRYSNNIESVGLRIYPYDHKLANRSYLSDVTRTNISKSFTYKMAAKTR